MTVNRAMVFAAGFGTRMQPLTEQTPKPLIRVAGRPLLDHALDLVSDVGATAVVNAHYLADQVATHVALRPEATLIVEEQQLLDTGGGLKNAGPILNASPVLTLNSDAVWAGPNPLELLNTHWRPNDMDALLMLIPISQTVGYSRSGSFVLDEAGRIAKDPDGLAYTGAQIIRTDGLADIPDRVFSMHQLWDRMIEDGRAFGAIYPGRWADVGTPEGIGLAEDMLRVADV